MGKKNTNFTISIIVPVYNEEKNIRPFTRALFKHLEKYSSFEIIYINDGSADSTEIILKELSANLRQVKFISFTKNFGHQVALKAGLDHAAGDCIVSLDGDFQHPPELIPEMIQLWEHGNKVVCTKRLDTKNQGLFKKLSSRFYYYILNSISEIPIESGAADFRLIDKNVNNELKKINNHHLYFRGLIPSLGFDQRTLEYKPKKRMYGDSKYSLKKMLNLASDGVTNMSLKPLHLSTRLGFFISLLSFSYIAYSLYVKLFTTKAIDGWTSLMISISLIGGVQLICLGILGEYVGKIFNQVKSAPIYVIKNSSIKSSIPASHKRVQKREEDMASIL
jgi:polyisoprenyl-phosphate glycosyltransferase